MSRKGEGRDRTYERKHFILFSREIKFLKEHVIDDKAEKSVYFQLGQ